MGFGFIGFLLLDFWDVGIFFLGCFLGVFWAGCGLVFCCFVCFGFLFFFGRGRFGVFYSVVVGVRTRVCWHLCSKPIVATMSNKVVVQL